MTPNTLKAYIVALTFELPGPVHASTWIAPDAPSAAALAAVNFMRNVDTDAPMTACLTVEIPAEQLRHMLRAVEGRLPESGNAEVLSIVPKPSGSEWRPPCPDDEHEWEDGACKRCRAFLTPHQYAEKKPLHPEGAA